MLYDTIILGGGPAGLTASIYACRAGLNVMLLEKLFEGGQLANTHLIDNYPGYHSVTGVELIEKLTSHAKKYSYQTTYEEAAGISTDVQNNLNVYSISAGEENYTAKTIIIATGAKPTKLGAKGEDNFAGRGVSYCATCDGTFYRDKDVYIIGGGNTAVQDAVYLSRLCRKVYVVHRRDRLRADYNLADQLSKYTNAEVIFNTVLEEITGANSVTGVLLKNVITKEVIERRADGVFIAVGIAPNSEFIRGFIDTDEKGFIITDSRMHTSMPGVFAAGDVRTSPLRQIVTAAADGAVAAAAVWEYIESANFS